MITRSSRFDVHSAYGRTARRRRKRREKNCIWSPGAVTAAGPGFKIGSNRMVDPRVVKGQGSYRLAASSPCRAHRPLP